jgi:hypothetical protein
MGEDLNLDKFKIKNESNIMKISAMIASLYTVRLDSFFSISMGSEGLEWVILK